jgi:D-sedoheptulose 7-phosphate isomerase
MTLSVAATLRAVSEHLDSISRSEYPLEVERAVDLLTDALAAGHTLFAFGNGGSAADAQHLCAELVGRFGFTRAPVAAIALGTDPALMTAWSNDVGFEDVFARQIEALGRPGDVAWGISTSGNSENVVRALERARTRGLRTIGLTGLGGGRMAAHCDLVLAVPLRETARVQEIHAVTYHAMCAALEARLFPHEAARPVQAAASAPPQAGQTARLSEPAPADG